TIRSSVFPWFIRLGVESRMREPKLTRCPRLCDLMSRKGLAYLSLGIETVERFNALFKRADGRGRRSKHGRFCARPGRLRARPPGLGRTDRSGAGVRRIACLYFAA